MNNRRKFFKSLGLLSATALVGGLHPKNHQLNQKLNGKWLLRGQEFSGLEQVLRLSQDTSTNCLAEA